MYFLGRLPTFPLRLLATGLSIALLLPAPGCTWFNWDDDPYSVSPSLEMGQEVSDEGADTEPFALTNEGRRIEDHLLNRERDAALRP